MHGSTLALTPIGYSGSSSERVRVDGKFFRLSSSVTWAVKGFTYGPFSPNADGEFLPARHRISEDFAHIRSLGSNAVRLYHVPPAHLLDEALAAELRVFIDIPWEKHRCFFEDWAARQDAFRNVRQAARTAGRHPATFALSVANEIPNDIVRFYGVSRIERFIGQLLDTAKQEAPDCLATYTNYPSTEFLSPANTDFACFNVYLEQVGKLGAYLDRLQHIAGNKPLILGEFGLDSLRHGAALQAEALCSHVSCVFQHGLAGSYVFSYTDDWFTGGHRIDNWAFGVTDRDRNEKPAARALSRTWSCVVSAGDRLWPKVSVVVCSYNGAATLEKCLQSLVCLDYPNLEVILVDDGSTDHTPEIAARFPVIRCIRQENRGLSAARNAGAEAATGDIVAYTDSDCVPDETWLRYLVAAMQDQKVAAVGGPNVPPNEDGWVAHCVAASPGGPSHVMLDDRYAEHVPGCNMAFDRRKLLDLGGFDVQFRQAGDDVDICWRFLDAGLTIGYAPAALVWHYRRSTVRAYLKQQKGYGQAEGMLSLKHPARFNSAGRARWNGVIYGDGANGLALAPRRIWHGRFGTGLFQVIYRHNQHGLLGWCMALEWHIAAALLLAAAVLWKPLTAIVAAMMALSLYAAARSAIAVRLPADAPFWCSPLVFAMNLLQPVVRSLHAWKSRARRNRIPPAAIPDDAERSNVKTIGFFQRDLYWRSTEGRGREHLLHSLVQNAHDLGWAGNFDAEWECWDAWLAGGFWQDVLIRTASEELGAQKRFTRVRCQLRATRRAWLTIAGATSLIFAALVTRHPWIALTSTILTTLGLSGFAISRARGLRAIVALVCKAGIDAGLEPASLEPTTRAKCLSHEMSELQLETEPYTG
jgi:O-antigen biosynthesis protein